MRHFWVRELGGWVAAALISIVTVAQLASTARSELLLRDGDSLVVALLVRSITGGETFDWVMSSVLFLPEIAVFAALWLIGQLLSLDVNAVLLINAVVNLVALYGAVRFVAGRRRGRTVPVGWSLVALSAFCLLVVTETSASRDALELASLLLTTTYYSATVIAVVLSVGLVRRAYDRPRSATRLSIVLAGVAFVSTVSNPLYAAWATAPLGVLLGTAAVYPVARRRALSLLAWLIGGTVIGFVGRIPLSAWIANSGAEYAQPGLWPESVRYYADLLTVRTSTPLGLIGTLLLAALLVFAVVQTVRARTVGARLVAAAGWAIPLLVVLGAIVLGTHAARYLEPLFFAPVLALVASPVRVTSRTGVSARMPRRAAPVLTAAAATLLLVGAGLSVPRAVAAAEHPNTDLRCVNEWVNASGQVGGGQFWTVRLPKLHLDEPTQLVQVDHQLNAYAWLVNQSDFAPGEVTFLIEDAQSSPWALGTNAQPTQVIACGQYTIYDFSPTALALGPPRS
ncbi:hypothetical protein [Microbacterium sp.]|uniref:hypothetical protein n=1 Tax=Microbacterium sp. TaxID=51671 RepID=UPI002615BD5E|nr:hypothetical protein [Microbacterium sp.]